MTVQVFGKSDAFLGGIDEAIAILKLCSDDWSGMTVRALHDGDAIVPWEVVLEIEGSYADFAHLEVPTSARSPDAPASAPTPAASSRPPARRT